jgi:hypothetical protein
MNDTGKVSQDGQTDVDQEVGTTSSLQENTQRGEDDSDDDLADVPVEMVSIEVVSRRRCNGANAELTSRDK